MAKLEYIPSGPFLHVGKRGLIWIGTPEKCDSCQDSFPTCWITFDGKRFLCTACNYEIKENSEARIQECDLCHYHFPLSEMTISYNQILCKKCASDNVERQRDFDEAEQNGGLENVRRKYE